MSFILIIVAIAAMTAAEIDYCDDKLCPDQGQHIRCNNSGEFSKDCIGECYLENLEPHIELILHEHNMYRNILASGKLKCFHPATRMPALYWNWDLAKNAEYNVKTCVFAHDQCRSTPEYPYVGQNIYYARTGRSNLTVEQFITEAIFLWFEEYLDADQTVLEDFRKTDPQSGHFTTLVNDRQNFVGCAYLSILQLGPPTARVVIFTCDYPSTNIHSMPSYKSGKPASECNKTDTNFESLCDNPIDPNDFDWYYD